MPSRHWYAIDQGRMYLNIESPEVGGRLRRESSRLEWGVGLNRIELRPIAAVVYVLFVSKAATVFQICMLRASRSMLDNSFSKAPPEGDIKKGAWHRGKVGVGD